MNFWEKLKKPIIVLAPMADVTDAAFRRVIAKYGKPDVFWTEFVSADGLVMANEVGKAKLLKDLLYSEEERPIVAQLFSGKPENMKKAAKLVAELGFNGIDINMGCPDRSVEKQGAGAALIRNPELAKQIIRAAKDGVKDAGKNIPVSVKTRIGYNKKEIDTWIPALLEEEPAVLTVHARTRKEMSKVPAQWGVVADVVNLRNSLKSKTLIFGNGDVVDRADAMEKARETGADGIMLGRAIFGNPWLFSPSVKKENLDIKERLKVLDEHISAFDELLGSTKNFAVMRKHFKSYMSGIEKIHDLKDELMNSLSAEEAKKVIHRAIL